MFLYKSINIFIFAFGSENDILNLKSVRNRLNKTQSMQSFRELAIHMLPNYLVEKYHLQSNLFASENFIIQFDQQKKSKDMILTLFYADDTRN